MMDQTKGERTLLNTIPPEILGKFFTYSFLHSVDGPLVLGMVCSTFCQIVRSTPKRRVCTSTPPCWPSLCSHLQGPPTHAGRKKLNSSS